MQRLNSWYNMHHKNGDIVSDLKQALKQEIVRRIHYLIINNTYDHGAGGSNDPLITLEYLQWLYPYVHRNDEQISAFGGYLGVTHMLMSCLYYPQLLIWLGVYSEMQLLSSHFKLMSFPYLTSSSTRYDALHDIYFWTRFGIGDNKQLNTVKGQLLHREEKQEMNKGGWLKTNSWSRAYPHELMEPLKTLFDAIAPHNDVMLRRFRGEDIFLGPPFRW